MSTQPSDEVGRSPSPPADSTAADDLMLVAGSKAECEPKRLSADASIPSIRPVLGDVSASAVATAQHDGQGEQAVNEFRTKWQWADATLLKKLAALDRVPLPPKPSPARLAGERMGALMLADAAGVTEPRRLEQVEIICQKLAVDVASLKSGTNQVPDHRATAEAKTAVRKSRRRKKTMVQTASKLLRQLEVRIAGEIRASGKDVRDDEVERGLIEKLWSRIDHELTATLAELYDFPLNSVKSVYRTPEYKRWAPYRTRGNGKRLDPESPAAAETAKGHRVTKSRKTANAGFVAAHGLRVASGSSSSSLPAFDALYRKESQADPKSLAFLREHPEFLDDDGPTNE